MPSEDPLPVSNFEVNNTDHSRRRRGKAGSSSARKPLNARKIDLAGPTPERLAKEDAPVKTQAGHYLAAGVLEGIPRPSAMSENTLNRLHHRVSLDHDPGMNDRMFEAGKRYEDKAYLAGLTGIAAQNLLSTGGGGSDPAYMMAGSTAVAAARAEVRKAWTIMGSKVAGAVHGILVEGRDAESVGRALSSYVSTKECRTAGMTTLRIGLWMLVNAKWA